MERVYVREAPKLKYDMGMGIEARPYAHVPKWVSADIREIIPLPPSLKVFDSFN